ncbi:superoxide dismutase [Streptomyces sp. NPDC046821]|uniref:superoxide dismutase n=1 Tax=Streptomyces sp. NPDC046821 TaxID=3154702 RepID=UPI0033CC4F57
MTSYAAVGQAERRGSLLELPPGFGPESLAIGASGRAYFGSLSDGTIRTVDLSSGEGRTLSPGPGSASGGLCLDDRGRLFVAGGFAGDARVIDTATGEVLARWQLADGQPTLIADVAPALGAMWFTDSFAPVLHRVPLAPDGRPARPDEVRHIPVGGDVTYEDGFNLSGISPTPDGAALLAVQANTGKLFRIDPATGTAAAVDLGGELLLSGDGMFLDGTTLYVALGAADAVAAVRLNAPGTSGTLLRRLTLDAFDIPTAIVPHAGHLYIVNSRLGSARSVASGDPDTVVVVPRAWLDGEHAPVLTPEKGTV